MTGLRRPEFGDRFQTELTEVQLKMIEDCGHLPFLEKTDWTLERLEAFWTHDVARARNCNAR